MFSSVNILGLSDTKLSAAILTDSCAPSVIPSVAAPLTTPLAALAATLGDIPDLLRAASTTAFLIEGLKLLSNCTGATSSSAELTAPAILAAAGSNLPVSAYIPAKDSGAIRA